MSYSGEAYIKKLNEEEAARQAKTRLVSDCCSADVDAQWTASSMYDPPQPFYVCAKCGSKCEALVVNYSEEDE